MIDTDKYTEIMKHDWLFDEQLFVGGGKWRFALTEYTDLIDMSEGDIEEWEEGLESVWEALVDFIADAPKILAGVKRSRERIKKLENALLTLADGAGDVPMFNKGGEAYEALWGEEE